MDVLLLRGIERRLGLSDLLAACMRDRRDQTRIDHPLEEMLRLRMFAIAAGYEDANDCATLRHDPVFKMAVERLPETGDPLCSQPTLSRLEKHAVAGRAPEDDGGDDRSILCRL